VFFPLIDSVVRWLTLVFWGAICVGTSGRVGAGVRLWMQLGSLVLVDSAIVPMAAHRNVVGRNGKYLNNAA